MMAVVPAVMAPMMTAPVVAAPMMAAVPSAVPSAVAAPGPCCARKRNRQRSDCCAYQSGSSHLSSFLMIGINVCRKRPETISRAYLTPPLLLDVYRRRCRGYHDNGRISIAAGCCDNRRIAVGGRISGCPVAEVAQTVTQQSHS
jgi:hypothetical protein